MLAREGGVWSVREMVDTPGAAVFDAFRSPGLFSEVNMIATATTPDLPALFRDCCEEDGPLSQPWLTKAYVVAFDQCVLVRAPLASFSREFIADLRATSRFNGTPNVSNLFLRWQPSGDVLELPDGVACSSPCLRCQGGDDKATCSACEGEGVILNRRRVRLANSQGLAGYRVALLQRHGVRQVQAGTGVNSPVRFTVGPAEGLLMPLVEETR